MAKGSQAQRHIPTRRITKTNNFNNMKTLQEVLAEYQGLATIPEDQFEAALQAANADLEEIVNSASTPATVATITITFSDGTTKEFDPKA